MKNLALILGLVIITSFNVSAEDLFRVEEVIMTVDTGDCDKCGKATCENSCEEKTVEKKTCSKEDKTEDSSTKPLDQSKETKKSCCSKKEQNKTCSKDKIDE